jgi:hypothetical protein
MLLEQTSMFTCASVIRICSTYAHRYPRNKLNWRNLAVRWARLSLLSFHSALSATQVRMVVATMEVRHAVNHKTSTQVRKFSSCRVEFSVQEQT